MHKLRALNNLVNKHTLVRYLSKGLKWFNCNTNSSLIYYLFQFKMLLLLEEDMQVLKHVRLLVEWAQELF